MNPPGRRDDALPNVPDWDEHTRLQAEKEILGFFITGHPMEKYKEKLADLNALSTQEIAALKKSTSKDENISAAGLISGLRVAKSQKRRVVGAGGAGRYVGEGRTADFSRGLQETCGESEARSAGAGARRRAH